ncbi:endonuclease/exonuclease/phosphatase family protein [Arthrobacter sp. Br18]|uniref:endonuclease/exonuclease/phosphatase family protein n=1 Tax=Arthrobacter sp. Br18 TaxID=1312954 RepID=UPI0004B288D5|nr:endonuclease/exonuclease/phosphatase family protein [Arthrobacter sp. Br18]
MRAVRLGEWGRRIIAAVAAAALVAGASAPAPAQAAPASSSLVIAPEDQGADRQQIRVATYNAGLTRPNAGDLVGDLGAPDDAQARAVAQVIQTNQPDVLLINEFDYDAGQEAAGLFRTNYLGVSQQGQAPADYPYFYTAPSNTGVPSGSDLNNDGTVGGPDDAYGHGDFQGQSGMVVYSKYPIDKAAVRTFQNFLWRDMPGARLPVDPVAQGVGWFSEDELDTVRLSSKSHWDIPVTVGNRTVHVLTSHPTSPVFDGSEDRNGKRNFDEIRLWADYIQGGETARYIYDDDGGVGGLGHSDRFVILGDLNSDPRDGDSLRGSIDQLLESRQVQDPRPSADGATEASVLQGAANAGHRGDPQHDTADFDDRGVGNLRADYVLPSRTLSVLGSGTYWPKAGTPGSHLTGIFPFPSSDHRLVHVDVKLRSS